MRAFRQRKPFNCPNNHRVLRFLYEAAFKQQLTMADLSERSGINQNTLRHWRYKSTPNIRDIDAALGAVGYEITVRRIKNDQ